MATSDYTLRGRTAYKFQARNFTNTDTVEGNTAFTTLSIERVLME